MNYPKFDGSQLCAQVGIEFFFIDDSGASELYQYGKRVCGRCHFITECAEWAIAHEESGLFGGLTPNERRAIRNRRNIMMVSPEVRFSRAN